MMLLLKRVLLVLVLLFLLIVSASLLYFRDYLNSPTNMATEYYEIRIERGMSVSRVSRMLKDIGVLENAMDFVLLCRFKDRTIPAGHYRIPPRLRPVELLEAFNPKNLYFIKLTIPEGSRLLDIAKVVESTLGIRASSFLRVCNDQSFASRLGIEGETLEGYLFPETYHFEPGVEVSRVAERMVKELFKTFDESQRLEAQRQGLTVHEVMTIASLLEKETAIEEERPLISAVIRNRLERRMPLQIDPTVIYGLKEFGGDLTREHLNTDTEYNTYTRKGLPPGPICSPSKSSIMAALHPAEVDYLYFVSMNNGHHKFSSTAKEHSEAVRLYQKNRPLRPGE